MVVVTAIPAGAGTLTWDANAAPPANGGTGIWDTGSSRWFDGSVDTTWSDGSDAVFINTAGTVTISGFSPSAASLNFNNAAGNYSITGGTITLTNTAQSILMTTSASSTNGQGITSTIAGTDITVYNNLTGSGNRTLLNLNGPNTFTGSLILGGDAASATALGKSNQVALGDANGLGGPSNLSTVKFARNFSNLLFTSGGAGGAAAYTASYGNDIDLNSTGSTGANAFTSGIGSANPGTIITLNGVIKGTGDASLIFTNGLSGGQGKIILANHETYSGSTSLTMAASATTTGIVALGINNALPVGTSVTLGNASGAPSGTLDMAGFNQKVAGIATSGTGFLGGITNTGAPATLTVSGNLTTTFGANSGSNTATGNIGATTITGKAELAGSNDNISLLLDVLNIGKLTLQRPAGNTYSGGTTVSGGTLILANTSGSATGSGPVVVNSGGTLGGNGIATGAVTVNGSGAIAPGPNGADPVSTLLVGPLTLNDQNVMNLDFELNKNDLVSVAGNLNLPSSGFLTCNLTDVDSQGIVAGNSYHVMSYTGTLTAPADLNTVMHVGTAPLNTYSFVRNGTFIDLQVTPVPEPSSMLLLGAAGLMLRRRSRPARHQ